MKTTNPVIQSLLSLRQSRIFEDRAISDDDVQTLLEVARWSGSSKNSQPWHLVVVRDADTKQALSEAGGFTQFLANSDVVIVILLKGGKARGEAYDEGRLSERVMLAAKALGIGSGTGWFSDPEAKAQVRKILDIPEDFDVWSALGLGYTKTDVAQAPGVGGGRKPLEDIVSFGKYGGSVE